MPLTIDEMTQWQEPCDVRPVYDVIGAQHASAGGDSPR
jgi:hypothetical protein